MIAVEGVVNAASAETINPAIATGEVEAGGRKALDSERIAHAAVSDGGTCRSVDVKEESRLKYRYVDLRRPHMQRNIILRSKVAVRGAPDADRDWDFSKSKRRS